MISCITFTSRAISTTKFFAATGLALAMLAGVLFDSALARPRPRTAATPGDDFVSAVAVRGAGIYVAGQTTGSLDGPNRGSDDVFVRKYNAEGDVLWAVQFGTPEIDVATGIAVDSAGNVYVVGDTQGSLAGSRGNQDGFLRKYNTNGRLIWTRQFGTTTLDQANAVGVDGSDNIYVTGLTFGALQGANHGGDDAYVRKYNPNGAVLWTRQFGTANNDEAHALGIDAGGNVYVAGATGGDLQGANRGGFDGFIVKYDSAGTAVWKRQFGTAGFDVVNGLAVDSTGAVIVAGQTSGAFNGFTNAGGNDAFVRKYSASGQFLYVEQFGTTTADIGSAIAVDPANNFYLAGATQGDLAGASAGGTDAFVRKYLKTNSPAWTRQFGTAGSDHAGSIAATSGQVYVGGDTQGALAGVNQGGFDGYLRQMTSHGVVVWTDQ